MNVHTELFTGVDVAFGIRGPEILSGLPDALVLIDGARSTRVDPQALYRCGGIFETTHAYIQKGSVWRGTIHFAYCGKQWYFLFDPEIRVMFDPEIRVR